MDSRCTQMRCKKCCNVLKVLSFELITTFMYRMNQWIKQSLQKIMQNKLEKKRKQESITSRPNDTWKNTAQFSFRSCIIIVFGVKVNFRRLRWIMERVTEFHLCNFWYGSNINLCTCAHTFFDDAVENRCYRQQVNSYFFSSPSLS